MSARAWLLCAGLACAVASGARADGAGTASGTTASGARPIAVSVHRSSVRLDLGRGTPIAGTPADNAPLPAGPVRLRAVRDEVLSLQLALRGGPRAVSIRATPPAGTRVDVFVERGVPVTKASVSTVARPTGPGLYPDPLVPTSTVHVPAEPGVSVLWIDVWTTPEALPGVHEGRIEIDGAPAVELAVEVLDLRLPSTEAARLGAVSFGSFLERRARNPARFMEWMQLAHAHRLTVELMHTRVATAADGALDWARWADDYAPLIDGRAFTAALGYHGPRSGLPTGRFVIPLSDRVPSPRTNQLLPREPERWSRELKRWEQEVERRGWLELPEATQWIVFINSLDEPRHASMLESLRTYGELIHGAHLVDRQRVAMRLDGPFAQGAEGWSDARIIEELGPAIDLWAVCGGTPWIPWRKLARAREQDPREQIMFYASNSSGEPATPPVVLDAELSHLRAWGWVVKRYALAGALNWEVDFRPGCATDPLCSTYGLNTDATLIYRGEELGRGFDEPIASMRLKMLRRGAEDAALVALLEAHDPDAARDVLERIVPAAMGDGHGAEGPGSWPTEGLAYERVREEILDRLLGRPVASAPRGAPWVWAAAGALVLGLLSLLLRRARRA